jgi:hypothetical protein
MKTRLIWSTGTAAVLALGLTANAQTPPPPSQPDRPRDTMAQSEPKEITLTGCVQKADMTSPAGSTSPGSTPSTSARSGSDDAKYILTSASMSSGASGATGTAGSTPGSSASAAGASSSYKLKGEEDDLAKFVGQRVEVRGRLDDKMSGSSPGSSASGSTASASAEKVLRVSSVRAASGGSCGEGR